MYTTLISAIIKIMISTLLFIDGFSVTHGKWQLGCLAYAMLEITESIILVIITIVQNSDRGMIVIQTCFSKLIRKIRQLRQLGNYY